MTQSTEDDDLLDSLVSDDDVDLDAYLGQVKVSQNPGSREIAVPLKPSLAHLGGSSLLGRYKHAKNLQAHEVLALLSVHPDITAQELIARAGTGWLHPGLMDGVNDVSQLNLFASLQDMRTRGAGAEYALIVKAPEDFETLAVDRLARHLEAMETDSVVFILLDSTRMKLESGLRRKGWKQHTHYEFLTRESLMTHEAAVLRKLLAPRPKAPLFLVRKLAQK